MFPSDLTYFAFVCYIGFDTVITYLLIFFIQQNLHNILSSDHFKIKSDNLTGWY